LKSRVDHHIPQVNSGCPYTSATNKSLGITY
jgi:hypothetical protein